MKRHTIFAAVLFASLSASADTEEVLIYDYGTGTFSQETIDRSNGTVNMRGYNYGTGTHYQYQGDADSGVGYDYGSGTFTDVTGNPYGIEE